MTALIYIHYLSRYCPFLLVRIPFTSDKSGALHLEDQLRVKWESTRRRWWIRRGWKVVRGREWFGNAHPPFLLLLLCVSVFHSEDQWSGRWIKRTPALFISPTLSVWLLFSCRAPSLFSQVSPILSLSHPHFIFCSDASCQTSHTKNVNEKKKKKDSQMDLKCLCARACVCSRGSVRDQRHSSRKG